MTSMPSARPARRECLQRAAKKSLNFHRRQHLPPPQLLLPARLKCLWAERFESLPVKRERGKGKCLCGTHCHVKINDSSPPQKRVRCSHMLVHYQCFVHFSLRRLCKASQRVLSCLSLLNGSDLRVPFKQQDIHHRGFGFACVSLFVSTWFCRSILYD